MQIVNINMLSLEERLQQLQAMKEKWEGTVLEQHEIRSSGTTAEALKQVMAEYDQIRKELLNLISITLTVFQNTEETFARIDKKLADAFAHITGIETSHTCQTPNVAPVVGAAAHILNALHNDN